MDGELWEWIKSILIAVVLAVLIRFFVLEVFLVDGSSMLPTLRDRERLIVNKFQYHWQDPRAGDVLIFSFSRDRDFIKRVIAVPGDEVYVDEETVYVNGEPLAEGYILEPTRGHFGPVTVPDGHYFVMGDNRNNSMDSRDSAVTFISSERIKGKAFLVFWPVDSIRLVHR
jgi:signal peptidase I